MLYGHGDDLYNARNKVSINFSSNVWHGANLSDLRAHLQETFYDLTGYPEPDAASLRFLLADLNEIDERNVIVTNGSITAFYLIAQAWQGAKSIIRVPSFAEYEDACRLYNHRVSFFSSAMDVKEISLSRQDICWICNPNNPDGKLVKRADLIYLLETYPETIFVIDQAYVDFTSEDLLHPSDVQAFKNLIIIQSISKAHNIPGLRIGYLVAPENITERIRHYIIPWSVNTIAIETGKYVLTHPEQFVLPLQAWRDETKRFMAHLRDIPDLEVLPTEVTFFLARLRKGKASDLKRFLVEDAGILIRDASNFRTLDEGYFRLSTQLPEENEKLIQGVEKWLLSQ